MEYHLTAEDYVALQLQVWEKSVTQISQSLGSWIIYLARGFVLCLLAFFLLTWIVFLAIREVFASGFGEKDLVPILCVTLLLLGLMIVLLRGFGPKNFARSWARRAARRQFRLQAKQMPERNLKVVLTPDKVTEICFSLRGKQETILDWTFIDSIDLAGQHAFFITANKMALIVPQRAFADERAFLDFVETAWAFHRRAGESPPAAESANLFLPEAVRPEERITTRSDDRSLS